MAHRFAVIALVLWLLAGTVLGGVMLVRHIVALPTPATNDPALRDAVVAAMPASGRWRALHIMYRACQCSQRTVAHLVGRARLPALDELVLIVDDDGLGGPDDARLREAGFTVRVITPSVLHGVYHVEAAPLLVIASPEGELAYVGGYNRTKQSPRYEDVSILAELGARHATEARPVFGCATSARLADALDPLGLGAIR